MQLARLTEQVLHAIGEMPRQAHRSIRQDLHPLIAAQRLEVTEIEMESTVFGYDDLAKLVAILISVLAIRGEAHHFALVAVFRVADEFADHGVKAAKRVRQKHAVEHFDFVALTAGHHGGDEVAGTVVAEPRRLLPR